eukprot:TRINITY_DN4109_c3_g1_i1.p1 TRINITY_DN4109_c3_g1~~TRINITY_DN4109_c3_g1_i1.p1  ORF type:complete len:615 (-),score=217.02 TRINITY_DN4109_c3_g1_i1:75-1868(-)
MDYGTDSSEGSGDEFNRLAQERHERVTANLPAPAGETPPNKETKSRTHQPKQRRQQQQQQQQQQQPQQRRQSQARRQQAAYDEDEDEEESSSEEAGEEADVTIQAPAQPKMRAAKTAPGGGARLGAARGSATVVQVQAPRTIQVRSSAPQQPEEQPARRRKPAKAFSSSSEEEYEEEEEGPDRAVMEMLEERKKGDGTPRRQKTKTEMMLERRGISTTFDPTEQKAHRKKTGAQQQPAEEQMQQPQQRKSRQSHAPRMEQQEQPYMVQYTDSVAADAGGIDNTEEPTPFFRPVNDQMPAPTLSAAASPLRSTTDFAATLDDAATSADAAAVAVPSPNVVMPSETRIIPASDMVRFINQPGPTDQMCQCKIQRVKKGVGTPPYFVVFMETTNQFIVSARKRRLSRTSNYLISLDQADLARASTNYVGKLRSNFLGTDFIMYDNGDSPKYHTDTARAELVAVTYTANPVGVLGPRKMTVLVPTRDELGRLQNNKPLHKGETLAERVKKSVLECTMNLTNKIPEWSEERKEYILDFGGRVKQASVKNFQLVDTASNSQDVLMQFGRITDNLFALDFKYPLSLLQTFGIALSSFDFKFGVE